MLASWDSRDSECSELCHVGMLRGLQSTMGRRQSDDSPDSSSRPDTLWPAMRYSLAAVCAVWKGSVQVSTQFAYAQASGPRCACRIPRALARNLSPSCPSCRTMRDQRQRPIITSYMCGTNSRASSMHRQLSPRGPSWQLALPLRSLLPHRMRPPSRAQVQSTASFRYSKSILPGGAHKRTSQ